jgi:hypothetical protein
MNLVNVVTAVSRPENLRRIHASMIASLMGEPIRARWILVFNEGDMRPIHLLKPAPCENLSVERRQFGGPSRFGVAQKNHGLDQVSEGFYHLLDDDNIVHPRFFGAISEAMAREPQKRAFAYGQQRWDRWGDLKATPETMEPNKIDNSMFVVHRDVIGPERYDPALAGIEDYHFFRRLYDKGPAAWTFLGETLAYYNFLRRA